MLCSSVRLGLVQFSSAQFSLHIIMRMQYHFLFRPYIRIISRSLARSPARTRLIHENSLKRLSESISMHYLLKAKNIHRSSFSMHHIYINANATHINTQTHTDMHVKQMCMRLMNISIINTNCMTL